MTVEDNGRVGGVGALVSQTLRDAGVDVPARDVGIPPRFLDHGSVAQVKAEIGLTAPGRRPHRRGGRREDRPGDGPSVSGPVNRVMGMAQVTTAM